MARNDSQGLFWNEQPNRQRKQIELLIKEDWREYKPGFWLEKYIAEDLELDHTDFALSLTQAFQRARKNAGKVACVPPEPVWLADDYLPNLEEAQTADFNLFTDKELIFHSIGGNHVLIFDVECYKNYFLVAFKSPTLGKTVMVEMTNNTSLETRKLEWLLDNFITVGFNSRNYDIPICAMAIAGCNTSRLKAASDEIIIYKERPNSVARKYKGKIKKNWATIDIIEVAPLSASLKIYGGRLGSRRMQDLPFPPDIELSKAQIDIMRWYCVNDLLTTIDLHTACEESLKLRVTMSDEYKTNLMSKSDAQIAEAVIGRRIESITGRRPFSPDIPPYSTFKYRIPHFLKFFTPQMQHVLETIRGAEFITSEYGKLGTPQCIKDLEVKINVGEYTMGIGGLHSKEKSISHYAGKNHLLLERDVVSYYPRIILNQGLHPAHLGPSFNRVYGDIVSRRLEAKERGDKATAASLKITINGSFGKFGNQYSILYSPDLLMQTTITGQLCLLMLIERLEMEGIPVVSANTDGVVIRCPLEKEDKMNEVIGVWEHDTDFETEATYYKEAHYKDVNNYIAVKQSTDSSMPLWDRVKTKGMFANMSLMKNPANFICVEAVIRFLIDGVPLMTTIENETDVSKFITVRTVKGGAVKLAGPGVAGEFLGKAVRWYYAKDEIGEIVYANSGKKVPLSDGAKPLMLLPDKLPDDIDLEAYRAASLKMMRMLGY